MRLLTATELIEDKLSKVHNNTTLLENHVVHSTSIKNLDRILSSGVIKASHSEQGGHSFDSFKSWLEVHGPKPKWADEYPYGNDRTKKTVSFSEYPYYMHKIDNVSLLLDKDELKKSFVGTDQSRMGLYRPIRFDDKSDADPYQLSKYPHTNLHKIYKHIFDPLKYRDIEREVRVIGDVRINPNNVVKGIVYHVSNHSANPEPHLNRISELKNILKKHGIENRLFLQHGDLANFYRGTSFQRASNNEVVSRIHAEHPELVGRTFTAYQHPPKDFIESLSIGLTNFADLIEARLYEGRKLLQPEGTPAFQRRARRFPAQVVPSARMLKLRDGVNRSSLVGGSDVAELGGERLVRDIRGSNLFGIHKNTSKGRSDIYSAYSDYDTEHRRVMSSLGDYFPGDASIRGDTRLSVPLSGPRTKFNKAIDDEARRMHKHVVRRAIKAGIFTRIEHEVPHPKNPDKKLKVKLLSRGPMFNEYKNTDANSFHDAYDHGVLGSDASFRGEAMSDHLGYLVSIVPEHKPTDKMDSYELKKEMIRRNKQYEDQNALISDLSREIKSFSFDY